MVIFSDGCRSKIFLQTAQVQAPHLFREVLNFLPVVCQTEVDQSRLLVQHQFHRKLKYIRLEGKRMKKFVVFVLYLSN